MTSDATTAHEVVAAVVPLSATSRDESTTASGAFDELQNIVRSVKDNAEDEQEVEKDTAVVIAKSPSPPPSPPHHDESHLLANGRPWSRWITPVTHVIRTCWHGPTVVRFRRIDTTEFEAVKQRVVRTLVLSVGGVVIFPTLVAAWSRTNCGSGLAPSYPSWWPARSSLTWPRCPGGRGTVVMVGLGFWRSLRPRHSFTAVWRTWQRVSPALRVMEQCRSVPTPAAHIATPAVDRYRTSRYDVYLPPVVHHHHPTAEVPADGWKVQECDGILLLPGAFVDAAAYRRPAALLARGTGRDRPCVVVVPSGQSSLGLVTVDTGWNVDRIRQTCRDVQRECGRRRPARVIRQWFLVGHSLGGFVACQLALDLAARSHLPQSLIPPPPWRTLTSSSFWSQIKYRWNRQNVDDSEPFIVYDRIVLWGTAPFLDFVPLLPSSDADGFTLARLPRIFILQGAQDQLRISMIQSDATLWPECWRRLQQIATSVHEEFIPDGTHDGFADYCSQAKLAASVSSAETQEELRLQEERNVRQQQVAVETTIRYFLNT